MDILNERLRRINVEVEVGDKVLMPFKVTAIKRGIYTLKAFSDITESIYDGEIFLDKDELEDLNIHKGKD